MANRAKTEPSGEAKAEAKADAKAEAKPDAKSEAKDGKPSAEMKADGGETQPISTTEKRKTDPGMSAVSEEGIPLSSAGIPVEPPAMPEAKRDSRHRSETVAMPAELAVGTPPAMPRAGDVENPTFMPEPDQVPEGTPNDPGTVPGLVPPGDSRSLRRGLEFALVYRTGSAVISRFGVVGTRGQWRVVEYPTPASASNGYAKECSRFIADGFSDYRE
jgi:hypothetical protein